MLDCNRIENYHGQDRICSLDVRTSFIDLDLFCCHDIKLFGVQPSGYELQTFQYFVTCFFLKSICLLL